MSANLIRRRARGLGGDPVLGHELRHVLRVTTRLGRTGSGRALMGALLIVGYVFLVLVFALSLHDTHAPDQEIISVGLALLLIGLCLIAPGLTSAVIVGERQRGTWDMLLVTPLRPTQIVLGKLAGRLAGVALLALLAVPFVLVAAVHGAVDEGFLAAFVVVAPASVLGLSAIGLVCSARCRTIASATAAAYAIAAVLCVLVPVAEVLLASLLTDEEPVLTIVTCPLASFICLAEGLSFREHMQQEAALAVVGVVFYLVVAGLGLWAIIRGGEGWLVRSGDRAAR